MKASARNLAFEVLVISTRNIEYSRRLMELRAFASGAGLSFKFDESSFELWSSNAPSGRCLFSVNAALGDLPTTF